MDPPGGLGVEWGWGGIEYGGITIYQYDKNRQIRESYGTLNAEPGALTFLSPLTLTNSVHSKPEASRGLSGGEAASAAAEYELMVIRGVKPLQ